MLGLWSLEKAMAPYSSTLAWKMPWTEEPGRLQSMGSQRVPGTREPGGLPSKESHRVGRNQSDLAAAAAVVSYDPLNFCGQL